MQILTLDTLFVGQETLFSERLPSTNDFLKALVKSQSLSEGYTVLAGEQTSGKGQNGNEWWSVRGDNLLTSILLRPRSLTFDNLHYLVYAVALGVRATVQKYIPQQKVEVKWPNDVVVAGHKISGILIENMSVKGNIQSIVGIGININQRDFEPFNFPPTSIRLCNKGEKFDTAEVFRTLCTWVEKYYMTLRSPRGLQQIQELYVSQLYRFGEVVHLGQNPIPYTVKGVNQQGQLILESGSKIKEVSHNEFNITWN